MLQHEANGPFRTMAIAHYLSTAGPSSTRPARLSRRWLSLLWALLGLCLLGGCTLLLALHGAGLV